MRRSLSQRCEHGAKCEVTLGIAFGRTDAVVVVQQAGHRPAEHMEDVPQRFAHQPVRAHHAGQRLVLGLEKEVVRLSAGRQYWNAPDAGVPRNRSDDVIANRTQEQICVFHTYSQCKHLINIIYPLTIIYFYEFLLKLIFIVSNDGIFY